MNKAPDAFRTISEVADHLETPAHVLRFWETRFPQVKPVKGAGGRRYYRPSDVALLAGIRRLLHTDGMTIRGVQKILRDQGVRHVAELGGESLPEPEALEALLPPARPEAEIVPLRRDPPPVETTLSQEPLDGPMPESLPEDMAPEELVAEELAPEVPALDDLAPMPAEPKEPALPEPPAPLSPPLGFGGFALDLDVPRAGEGGFIAFSGPDTPAAPEKPQGFVHPDARPKAREAERQPSLFDLGDVPEAPHVFVVDEDEAEVTAFPSPSAAEDPAADTLPEALLVEEAPEPDLPEPDAPDWNLPEAEISAEAAIQALLGDSDLGTAPEPDEAPAAESEPPAAEPAADPAASPEPALLAGLVPRLRALPLPQGDALFALADLQARLGLLHAQMVEAGSRPRRSPGE